MSNFPAQRSDTKLPATQLLVIAVLSMTATWMLFAALGYTRKPADWLLVAAPLLVGVSARSLVTRRRAASSENILILGNGRLAGDLRKEIATKCASGISAFEEFGSIQSCGTDATQLRKMMGNGAFSSVIVADDRVGTSEDLTSLLLECKVRGVLVQQASDFYERLHKKMWLEALRPQWLLYSDVFKPTRGYTLVKRALDLCCAIGILLFTFPLLVLIALAIKIDSRGPVLYRQERVGQFGIPFVLYKFRSMREDAERDTGPIWASKNDERVTRIGRILRRSHLDELPQIFNVLKNELAFVGPRPERQKFVIALAKQIPLFHLREFIKPGITGWAQVCFPYGDSVEAAQEKLQFDLYYAKYASVGFDLKILFRTVVQVLCRRGR